METLASELAPALRALYESWRQMGLTTEQQATNMRQIVHEMSVVFHAHQEEAQETLLKLSEQEKELETSIPVLARRLGESSNNATASAGKNLPLKARVDYLNSLSATMTEKLQTRIRRINELFDEYKLLHREIYGNSTSMPAYIVEVASSNSDQVMLPVTTVGQLQLDVDALRTQRFQRREMVALLTKSIVDLWAELGMEPQTELDQAINDYQFSTLVSDEMIKRIDSKLVLLNDEKAGKVASKHVLMSEIATLWDRLSIDDNERSQFLKATSGFSAGVFAKCAEELERLKILKRQHLSRFVMACRTELQALWDRLYMSEQERRVFAAAFTDVFTEEALTTHEHEVLRLQNLVVEYEPILSAVNEHKQKMQEWQDFLLASNDPQRLTNRSVRGDPGRLLREEKMRSAMKNQVPKMEEALRDKLIAWQDEHQGAPFTVDGKPYLAILEEFIQERNVGTKKVGGGIATPLNGANSKASTGAAPSTPNRSTSRAPLSTSATLTPTASNRLQSTPVSASKRANTLPLHFDQSSENASPTKRVRRALAQ